MCSSNSEPGEQSNAFAGNPDLTSFESNKPSEAKNNLVDRMNLHDSLQTELERDISALDEVSYRFADKVKAYTFGELVELEKKLDPSLGFLKHKLKRVIIAKMRKELEIGLELLG